MGVDIVLEKGEWFANADGSLRLLMQDDGDLVLMTSQIVPGCAAAPGDDGANGILQGISGVNAVYQVDTQGSPSDLGQMAYLDEDGSRHTYGPEQLSYTGNQFVYKRNQRLAATQGQELSSMTTDTADACQDACVALVGSAGAGVSCAAALWQKDTQTCSLRDAAYDLLGCFSFLFLNRYENWRKLLPAGNSSTSSSTKGGGNSSSDADEGDLSNISPTSQHADAEPHVYAAGASSQGGFPTPLHQRRGADRGLLSLAGFLPTHPKP
jgi:hypothetical protein